MEFCHLAAARHVKLWSLNANLFFENTSLESSNCNILGLSATVVFSVMKPDLLRLRCSSGYVLSETKSVTPSFFTFMKSLTHHLSMAKFSEKNQCWKIFARRSNSTEHHISFAKTESIWAVKSTTSFPSFLQLIPRVEN